MQVKALRNEDVLKGYWKQISGALQSQWGSLTNDDLTRMKGDWTQLVGMLQKRYGYSKVDAESRVNAFVSNWHLNIFPGRDSMQQMQSSVGDAVGQMQSRASDAAGQMQDRASNAAGQVQDRAGELSSKASKKLGRKKKRRRAPLVLLFVTVGVIGVGYWLYDNLL